MAETTATSDHTRSSATGSIYDLGYRNYKGERLGRRYAFVSLYTFSLRSVFGLGRSWLNKAFPIGLALIALAPAVLQLAIAAVSPTNVELVKPEGYFGYVGIVVALFCAVVAPELVGRDQRNRTLPLYFSRALARVDYVTAKFAALTVALFAVLIAPQLVLLLGNALSTQEFYSYLQDNANMVPPIFATSLLIAFLMSSLTLAIACQTPKRALSTGVVLAFFVILGSLGAVLVDTTTGTVRSYVILVSPINVGEGVVYWLFDAPPVANSTLAKAAQDGVVYLGATLAYIVVSVAIIYRKFFKVVV